MHVQDSLLVLEREYPFGSMRLRKGNPHSTAWSRSRDWAWFSPHSSCRHAFIVPIAKLDGSRLHIHATSVLSRDNVSGTNVSITEEQVAYDPHPPSVALFSMHCVAQSDKPAASN